MANKSAAKKYIRVSEKNRVRNRAIRSSVQTSFRKVVASIGVEGQTRESSMKLLKSFEKIGMKSVSKGVFRLNTISRRLSRLYARVKNHYASSAS